jgi:hypothetical protein
VLVIKGSAESPASPSARADSSGNAVSAGDITMTASETVRNAVKAVPALEHSAGTGRQHDDDIPTLGASATSAGDGDLGAHRSNEPEAGADDSEGGSQQQDADMDWAAGKADDDVDDEATLDEDEVSATPVQLSQCRCQISKGTALALYATGQLRLCSGRRTFEQVRYSDRSRCSVEVCP